MAGYGRAAAAGARCAALAYAALVLAGCAGPGPPDADREAASGRSPIVTTERGPRGGYLVFVGPRGARTADLTGSAGAQRVLDRSPAYSPDGQWIAFASTRGRASLAETSLWLVRAEPGAEPRRLTGGGAVDRDPAWMPDGDSIAFSSSRGGSFDLYELSLEPGPDGELAPAGEPEPLATTPQHALAPSPAPDGDRVAYMVVDEAEESMSLWIASARTGSQTRLTRGPRDMTPAWSPRGDAIAFAAPAEGRGDTDLFAIAPEGGDRRAIVAEPLSDETGPAFSADGRHLVATAVYRSVADGAPILSSVVIVDLDEPETRVRALHDPVAVQARVGVALGPTPLDAAAIRDNPRYADALRDAVARQLRREQRELERRARDADERAPDAP